MCIVNLWDCKAFAFAVPLITAWTITIYCVLIVMSLIFLFHVWYIRSRLWTSKLRLHPYSQKRNWEKKLTCGPSDPTQPSNFLIMYQFHDNPSENLPAVKFTLVHTSPCQFNYPWLSLRFHSDTIFLPNINSNFII